MNYRRPTRHTEWSPMDLHVAPEELSRAISLADECARTLALIDIEPGTADALGAPDLTSAAAAYATARTTSAHHRAQRADRLADGARAPDLYAQTLDAAAIAAENLRRRAAHALTTAHTDPAAATATATEITTAWNTLRTTITTVATRTAALLTTTNTDTNDTADTTGDTANPRTSSGKKTDGPPATDEKAPLSDDDIKRIARQADGSGGWGSPRQGTLNDCYLLSALQGYSRSADGSQNLRDRVNWDPDKKAFVVTLYDKGEPVNVDVTDYYTNGAKDPFGKPTIMSIYERAYGIHYGDKNLDDGGTGAEAMEAISGEETHSVHTFGFTWGFIPWQQHQYTEDEWNDIKNSAQSGKPTTGVATGGDFSEDDGIVQATTDANGDLKITDADEQGTYRIAKEHVYTVVAVDDGYVTLRNPWGHNKPADGYQPPAGDRPDGLIRITREEYEQRFNCTDIGSTPR